MSSDLLSEGLRLIDPRVTFRGISIEDRWALRFHSKRNLMLHAAMRRSIWLAVDQDEPFRLDVGDIAVSNGGVPFVLASDPSVTPRDAEGIFAAEPTAAILPGDAKMSSVVGLIQMEFGWVSPLLETLRTVTHVAATDPGASALHVVLDHLLDELSQSSSGSEVARDRYAQLLLALMLRRAFDGHGASSTGWLRLLADAKLRPAVALMHEHPAHPWQLADLAKSASMSATTFSTRFRTVSGLSPLAYLHRWRVSLAQAALRNTNVPIATVASEMGYASETSFSHAFSRITGISPRRCRNVARNSDASLAGLITERPRHGDGTAYARL